MTDSFFEDLTFIYGSEQKTISFDKNDAVYRLEANIRFNGSAFLYPFDKYTSILLVAPPKLSVEQSTVSYNNEFVLEIKVEKDRITLLKRRNTFPFFARYLFGILPLTFFVFKFRKYSSHHGTKLSQSNKILSSFAQFLACLSFSLILSLGSGKYVFSLGSIPIGLLVAASIFFYVRNLNMNSF